MQLEMNLEPEETMNDELTSTELIKIFHASDFVNFQLFLDNYWSKQ